MPLHCQIWANKIKTTHSYQERYQLIPVIFCYEYLVLVFVKSQIFPILNTLFSVLIEIKRFTCRWIMENLCANLIIFVWQVFDSLTIFRLTTIHKLTA
jgi:hypothetical protein